MSINLPKTIFLFGHRQGHGKDTCCDILEKYLQNKDISYSRTSFAKKLKQHAAERYGLDASKMDSQEYKDWCPPWIKPYEVNVEYSHIAFKKGYIDGQFLVMDGEKYAITSMNDQNKMLTFLKPRSVRQILIEEGCKGRDIWQDTWAFAAYSELFNTGTEVGFISDFRFPNEYDSFNSIFDLYCEREGVQIETRPSVVKVQVYRKNGIFKNDGADAEIPDDFGYWHYNIVNSEVENWYNVLEEEVSKVFEKYHGGQNALECHQDK